MGILWFILGMMVGCCLGVFLMCCLSIHRVNKYEAEIRRLRNIVENGEVTTGIKALKRNPFVASGTYTVSGVRVADNDKLPRGLYIQNGKKRIR